MSSRHVLFSQVYSFSSLLTAFKKARRAKRGKGGEPGFYLNIEDNLLRLSRELEDRTYQPDPYRYFRLNNTKERLVSEASFRDRVVHHSLVGALEEVFEPGFIHNSYACRKDKGMHRALKQAHCLARKLPCFLKLDVEKYFASIDHDVLFRLLEQRIEDDGILWLCRTLMRHASVPGVQSPTDRGLPIGNLTSQFWANVYLDVVDQTAWRMLGDEYLRYMDDMLFFAHSRQMLKQVREAICEVLSGQLKLALNERSCVLAPVSEGIPWLGFRVFPANLRMDRGTKKRFARKMTAAFRKGAAGYPADDAELARAASLVGHAGHADTFGFRQALVQRLDRQHQRL